MVDELTTEQEPITEGGESTAVKPAAEVDGGSAPQEEEVAPLTHAQQAAVDKRIGEIRRKQGDADRDAAYWKGQAEASQRPVQPVTPEPVATAPLVRPKQDDYEYGSGEFEQAMDVYDADRDERLLAKAREEGAQSANQAAATTASQAADQGRLAQINAAIVKYPDINSVVTDVQRVLALTEPVKEAMDGEHFADILNHIGTTPGLATKLSVMNPVKQVKEIARIEGRFIDNPTPIKPTSTAPNPTATIPTGVSVSGQADVRKMTSMERQAKWDSEREAKLKNVPG